MRGACGRTGSSSSSTPAGTSSIAANTVSEPSSAARLRACRTHAGVAPETIHAALPSRTRWPSTMPSTP